MGLSGQKKRAEAQRKKGNCRDTMRRKRGAEGTPSESVGKQKLKWKRLEKKGSKKASMSKGSPHKKGEGETERGQVVQPPVKYN